MKTKQAVQASRTVGCLRRLPWKRYFAFFPFILLLRSAALLCSLPAWAAANSTNLTTHNSHPGCSSVQVTLCGARSMLQVHSQTRK